MAVTITKVGTAGATFVASWNVTVSGITAGDLLVVAVGGSFDAGVWTVTDSASNTYQSDAVVTDTSQHNHVQIFSAVATSAPTTVTIHDSTTGGNGGGTAIVYDVTGSDTSAGRVDQANGATNGNTTAPSVSTAATTNANDWVLGAFCGNTFTTPTAGSGYTQLDSVAANTGRSLFTEWKSVAATGVQTANMTLGAADTVESLIVAYKQASAGPTNPFWLPQIISGHSTYF